MTLVRSDTAPSLQVTVGPQTSMATSVQALPNQHTHTSNTVFSMEESYPAASEDNDAFQVPFSGVRNGGNTGEACASAVQSKTGWLPIVESMQKR